MPKALSIDDDMPRRRGRAKAAAAKSADVEVDVERSLLLRVLLHSPKDTFAGLVALAAIIAIIVNAMFLQVGRHPAPMFHTAFPVAGPVSQSTSSPTAVATSASSPNVVPSVVSNVAPTPMSGPLPRPRPVEADARSPEPKASEPAVAVPRVAPVHAAVSTVPRPPAAIPVSAHNDPVGDLIVSTRRVAAVQRVLTEYGYGQLKPTGVVGTDTQAAIQRFEREQKLPVTGQMSDRLVHELDAKTGRNID